MVDNQPKRDASALAARRIVLLIFLLSGFAGLVYEVVWARQLVLVFGNTTQAISAILTGFFSGMAIGSVLGGRIADRVRRPLRMYAILELLVVIAVLMTPITFGGLHEVYRGAFGSLEQNPNLLALVRFGLSILALGPATVLMGATLPTLSRWLVRDHKQMGEGFGKLYAANTFGAILGTLASGLVLIELIGLKATLEVGAACSATAGVVALVLSWWVQRTGSSEDEIASKAEAGTPAKAAALAPAVTKKTPSKRVVAAISAPADELMSRPKLALLLAFVSGLTSLGYQNLWTRILSSGTGSSSYIFTAVLAIFLTGIAIGAFIFSRFLSRTRRPIAILAVAELLLALVVLGTLWAEVKFPFALNFQEQLLFVVAPATMIMGIVFPMTSMLVADSDEKVGSSAGMLLGANTFGAICGTFVVPFVLMPVLTSPRSVILIAGINAVTGLILLTEAKSLRPQLLRFGRAVAVASAVGAVVLMVVPNRFATDPSLNMLHRSKATVLAQAEDDIAAVQASNTGGSLQLYVDGYTMTALTDDTRMMAHLPQMIRPNAKSMCVIAFGMGSSYRSSMIEGLKTDAVELVPSVPGMFPYFYPDASQYLDDPNGQILIADGRNHVDLTTSKYDLLIVDPPPPMNSSGTAVLFSQEFYQSASARLNSGGVMMEWEYDGQSVDEFRSHVKTFSSVFKHVTLVFGAAQNTVGVMMVGSNDPIVLDPANIEGVLAKPGVLADLNSAPDSPTAVKTAAQWEAYILGNVWISDSKAAQFGASGTLITDDRPYTEYDLLRHLFGPSSPPAIKANLLALMPRAGG